MKRVGESTEESHVRQNSQNAVEVIEKNGEPKPEIANCANENASVSVQALPEKPDEQPNVTVMPGLHGRGAVGSHQVEAVSGDAEPPGESVADTSVRIRILAELTEPLGRWELGDRTFRNIIKAERLAAAMAAQGNPVAMFRLGEMRESNAYEADERQKCRKLVAIAAKRGWMPALAKVREQGADRNTAAACERAMLELWPALQQLAARESCSPLLPEGPLEGTFSEFNDYMWQLQLAREGLPHAMRNVAKILLKMPFDDERAKKACAWLESAAAAGDTKAMLALGMMVEHGIGVARDLARALALHEQAAASGLEDAQIRLSSVYTQDPAASVWREAGLVTDIERDKAYALCLRAAEAGNLDAKLHLAQMHATGNGAARDVKAAFALCKEAADGGFDNAYLPLALMYLTGMGTDQDEDEAMYYLRNQWSDKGYAVYELAIIYEGGSQAYRDTARRFGMQISVNRKRAFALFRESALHMQGDDAHIKVKELVATGNGAFLDEEEALDWDRYENWTDDCKLEFPSNLDQLPPEKLRQLVEHSIRTGTWKPSRGECINLKGRFSVLYFAKMKWTLYLPHALRDAPRLKHLILSDNDLGDESADDIAEIIRRTKTLEVLDLGGSHFHAAGVQKIAAAMRGNFTLRRVGLNDGFVREEFRLIRSLCARNRKLQTLWAEFNWPSPLTFVEVPPEISELLEHHLIAEDQKDGSQSASATRQRVLEMLMCLEPKVLQPKVLRTTADPRTT